MPTVLHTALLRGRKFTPFCTYVVVIQRVLKTFKTEDKQLSAEKLLGRISSSVNRIKPSHNMTQIASLYRKSLEKGFSTL